MAPLHLESLDLLVNLVGIQDIDTQQLFSSVKSIRGVARMLGRALNHLIIHKNLDGIDPKLRKTLLTIGVDLDELSAVVETREIVSIAPVCTLIAGKYIRKIFNFASE